MGYFFNNSNKFEMIEENDALQGRDGPVSISGIHYVNGTSIIGPYSEKFEIAYFALGCFWGAERLFWQLDGVYTTAVGYQGGYTPNPTYEETCTGRTGHAESVLIVYDPEQVSYKELLKVFFEEHDPTQYMRQGNDVGTQYRSAIFPTTDKQLLEAREVLSTYNESLRGVGRDDISTEIYPLPAPMFYFAEEYHQQYLAKNPNGYCGLKGTGISCPILP